MNKALTDLLEQQRYFDALLQLGPLLEEMRAMTPPSAEEPEHLAAILRCLYALDMGMVADAYAIRYVTLLHQCGQTGQALIALNEAFKHHPEGVALYLCAGELMQQLSRLNDAIRCFDQVLALDPWHAVALAQRAHVNRLQQQLASTQ